MAGGALIGLPLACRLRGAGGDAPTPWRSMASDTTSRTAERALRAPGPGLAGTFLVIVACGLLVRRLTVYGATPVLAGTALLALATVLPTAFATRWAVGNRAGRATDAPPRSDAQVAAHLHDSVLQTLALIQRAAHDPARVSRLARGQERDLRDGLAGRDAARADTLAAPRTVARGVEDVHAGAVIEVVCVADTPLTAPFEVMVGAAREAMVNAARHAGTRIQVYAECEDEGVVTVFVRDTGAGFDLDDVPAQRRGVRDADHRPHGQRRRRGRDRLG